MRGSPLPQLQSCNDKGTRAPRITSLPQNGCDNMLAGLRVPHDNLHDLGARDSLHDLDTYSYRSAPTSLAHRCSRVRAAAHPCSPIHVAPRRGAAVPHLHTSRIAAREYMPRASGLGDTRRAPLSASVLASSIRRSPPRHVRTIERRSSPRCLRIRRRNTLRWIARHRGPGRGS